MKSKTYNGEVRSREKDFETLQLGAFATPGLLLAQGPEGLTAESRLNKKEAVPGAVISIQTFGDLVNFHPHLHYLVSDGCFMPNGWFYVLPEIDVKKLESLFRHKVLKLLLREKKISREWVEKLLSWRNSGLISIILETAIHAIRRVQACDRVRIILF